MKTNFSLKGLTYLLTAVVMFLASCSDNNKIDFTVNDASNLEGEATSDAYSSDAQDVSTDAIGGVDDTTLGGRSEGTVVKFNDNDRLKCATVTVTPGAGSTKDAPKGTITIVFPADGSCADSRGIVRKGTITITYTGRRFVAGSVITTTFTNYFVAGIKVEGTHTLTNVTPDATTAYPKFNVVIAGGKLTFLNGQTITREQDFTREWQRAANPLSDKWVLFAGGKASGSNRNGKVYAMNITKDLVYSRACQVNNKVFIAVSGEKVFTSDSKTMTINYGDGNCDNTVTITVNGKTKEVTIKGDGN